MPRPAAVFAQQRGMQEKLLLQCASPIVGFSLDGGEQPIGSTAAAAGTTGSAVPLEHGEDAVALLEPQLGRQRAQEGALRTLRRDGTAVGPLPAQLGGERTHSSRGSRTATKLQKWPHQ